MLWVVPYGLPFEFLLDRQTCFLGECLENCETLGVMVFFMPAESHEQLPVHRRVSWVPEEHEANQGKQKVQKTSSIVRGVLEPRHFR